MRSPARSSGSPSPLARAAGPQYSVLSSLDCHSSNRRADPLFGHVHYGDGALGVRQVKLLVDERIVEPDLRGVGLRGREEDTRRSRPNRARRGCRAGSQDEYSSQPYNWKSPNTRHASRMATISACAVGPLAQVTWLTPVAITMPAFTTTAVTGPPPRCTFSTPDRSPAPGMQDSSMIMIPPLRAGKISG